MSSSHFKNTDAVELKNVADTPVIGTFLKADQFQVPGWGRLNHWCE